ncbi:MAG: response regulator transcription factor [Bacteroidia bacterium]|jgi:two-component system copper resistance phosphate regulon response regulator CusR|nr:MAG: response regulator transcription factor [Bacteroidia bacterium]
MKILIVEDEPKVASFIKKGLEENHYESDIVYDGRNAEKLAAQFHYDLFIVDIIIPFVNGLDLCRQLKKIKPDIPVLMLTALGTTEDKLLGFDAGANDYLVKPFEFRELLARVKVLIRTSNVRVDSINRLVVADLELNLDNKVARRGSQTIELTAKEFSLLEYFMRNSGRVLSRNDIAEKVWEANFDFGTNVVDVYVNFLRKKIDRGFEKKLIHTRIGLGYIFKED